MVSKTGVAIALQSPLPCQMSESSCRKTVNAEVQMAMQEPPLIARNCQKKLSSPLIVGICTKLATALQRRDFQVSIIPKFAYYFSGRRELVSWLWQLKEKESDGEE
ncbi:hypothetical protein H8959_008105 [Pygathrix nigripes]